MVVYQVTVNVDAAQNSIAQQTPTNPNNQNQNNQNNPSNSPVGGKPRVVSFNPPLTVGDVLTIQTPITNTWNSSPNNVTNAAGALVSTDVSGQGQVQISWNQFNPGTPQPTPGVVTVPESILSATNCSFGIGCLVGSLDQGSSFFAIGTSFTTTILGTGYLPLASTPPAVAVPELWLFFWDINSLDNSGTMPVTVTVIRASVD